MTERAWKRWVCDKLRQLIVDIERGDALVVTVDVRNHFDGPSRQHVEITAACRVPLVHEGEGYSKPRKRAAEKRARR